MKRVEGQYATVLRNPLRTNRMMPIRFLVAAQNLYTSTILIEEKGNVSVTRAILGWIGFTEHDNIARHGVISATRRIAEAAGARAMGRAHAASLKAPI
jgi:hypothetical protein